MGKGDGGACTAILACFCFPKLLKVEGYDFGGEGGDACVEVVARNGRHLCEARCPTGKMLLEELFCQVEVCLRRRGVACLCCAGGAIVEIGHERQFACESIGRQRRYRDLHARNIYSKCGVHSQQEFMDFVHLDSCEGE